VEAPVGILRGLDELQPLGVLGGVAGDPVGHEGDGPGRNVFVGLVEVREGLVDVFAGVRAPAHVLVQVYHRLAERDPVLLVEEVGGGPVLLVENVAVPLVRLRLVRLRELVGVGARAGSEANDEDRRDVHRPLLREHGELLHGHHHIAVCARLFGEEV